jgi:hypothetical protein
MRPDVVAVVRFRLCDRDRADRVKPVGGMPALKAVAVGLVKALHILSHSFVVGHDFAPSLVIL